MYLGTDGEPLEPLNDPTGKKSIPLAVVNEATLKALGFTPADKNACQPPYDKVAHVRELEEAGIPTRLYTAETGDEFSAIIADEVVRMKRTPLSEDGRDLLSYWLGNAKDLSYHGVSDTRAARYIGGMAARWEHKHTVQVLQALHTVLLFHVQKDTGMVAAVNALIPPDGKHVSFDDPSGPIPWWHAKFMRLQDIGYAVGSRFDNEKVGAGHRTADFLDALLHPAKPQVQVVVETQQVGAGEPPEQSEADMLTIRESAKYANVGERTIRNWLGKQNGDKGPMLAGVMRVGKKSIRIPRGSLEPWRK